MTIDDRECIIEFGKFIREGREKKGIYQSDMAERMGMTQAHYSHIESGKRNTSLTTVLKICEELNLDFRDFLAKYMK